MRDELGGGVEVELREVAAAEARNAEVLYDDPVGANVCELRKFARRLLERVLVEDGVEGNVHLLAPLAREAHEA